MSVLSFYFFSMISPSGPRTISTAQPSIPPSCPRLAADQRQRRTHGRGCEPNKRRELTQYRLAGVAMMSAPSLHAWICALDKQVSEDMISATALNHFERERYGCGIFLCQDGFRDGGEEDGRHTDRQATKCKETSSAEGDKRKKIDEPRDEGQC